MYDRLLNASTTLSTAIVLNVVLVGGLHPTRAYIDKRTLSERARKRERGAWGRICLLSKVTAVSTASPVKATYHYSTTSFIRLATSEVSCVRSAISRCSYIFVSEYVSSVSVSTSKRYHSSQRHFWRRESFESQNSKQDMIAFKQPGFLLFCI